MNIFAFTSTGSLLITFPADATVQWLLDTCTVRLEIRGLKSIFVEARNEQNLALEVNELLSTIIPKYPVLLLLEKDELMNLPSVAHSFLKLDGVEGISIQSNEEARGRGGTRISAEVVSTRERTKVSHERFSNGSERRGRQASPKKDIKRDSDIISAWIGELQSEEAVQTRPPLPPTPIIQIEPPSVESTTALMIAPPDPPIVSIPPRIICLTIAPRKQSQLMIAPPILIAPPPPPPPVGFASEIVSAKKGNVQNELMNLLNSPDLKNRLKKSTRNIGPKADEEIKKTDLSAEAKERRKIDEIRIAGEKAEQERKEERENLVVEMLGFMETPNGSIEDLLDKVTKTTATARGFIYTLVRRGWVKGFRIKKPETGQMIGKRKFVPCTVFPGREWTSALELPDETAADLEIIYAQKEWVSTAHLYRFDQGYQRHVIDQIDFYKAKFPSALMPFTRPEPKQDSSLENRNKWEIWQRRKIAHDQSDSAQYHLISTKLAAIDQTLVYAFDQLEITIGQIREMNKVVTESFAEIPLEDLRRLIQGIPSQIKMVAKKLHESDGIIIKDTDLKLTPAFLVTLSEGEKDKKKDNRKSFLSLGGIPIETVAPFLKSLGPTRTKNLGIDEKALRRFTMG